MCDSFFFAFSESSPSFFLSLFIYFYPFFLLFFFLSFFLSFFRSFLLSFFLSFFLSVLNAWYFVFLLFSESWPSFFHGSNSPIGDPFSSFDSLSPIHRMYLFDTTSESKRQVSLTAGRQQVRWQCWSCLLLLFYTAVAFWYYFYD